MIQFQCDYTEGAHPKIIERLTRTNLEQDPLATERTVTANTQEN